MSGYVEWNTTSFYAVNDIVIYSGTIYVCIQANFNKIPPANTAYWASGSGQNTPTLGQVLAAGNNAGGVNITNVGTLGYTTLNPTAVNSVSAGTGINVGGTATVPIVALTSVGTPNTYSNPTSITTDATGRVSAITTSLNPPVASVSAGTNITITGTPTAPIINAAAGSKASLFSASGSASVVLSSTQPNNILVIPVPPTAQTSTIFKVHISGNWSYNGPNNNGPLTYIWCSTTSLPTSIPTGDTYITWSNPQNTQTYTWGVQPAIQTAGGTTATFISNDFPFLVQNATNATTPNLYLVMAYAFPPQANGSVVFNFAATVEAFP